MFESKKLLRLQRYYLKEKLAEACYKITEREKQLALKDQYIKDLQNNIDELEAVANIKAGEIFQSYDTIQ